MSRNTSILAFYLKNGIYRVIGISLVMATAEMLLFMTGSSDTITTFGDCIDASHIAFVLPAALLLHFILNSSILGKSSMNMIAAGRLQVTGKQLFRSDVLAQAAFLLVIYGAQVAVLLVLARLYPGLTSEKVTELSVTIDFMRNSFLHSVLPLSDLAMTLRNVVSLITLAEIIAVVNLMMRTGEKHLVTVIIPTYLIVMNFVKEFERDFTQMMVFTGFVLIFTVALYALGLSMAGKKEGESEKNE
ncbi:MAG: hypothetical protein ACI4LP_04195 [Anaerovoracaceae bacterium]